MRKAVCALAVAHLSAVGVAAAAEGQENLFAGDLGNAFWTLVIFVLVVMVLGRFAWKPLLSAMQQRENFIRDSLLEAKADRKAAEARLAEYERKLASARGEATEIVEEGRRDAEVLRRKIEEDARAEADKMVDRARREIDLAKQTAIKEIYETGAMLATGAAARVIRREVSPEDHRRLIADSIRDLTEKGTS